MHATFTPERLGHSTTVSFEVQTAAPPSHIPPPLTEVTVRYPAGLGLALSGLGIDTCSAKRLEAAGPNGCPPDSIMGEGSAVAEIQFGPQILKETAQIALLRAPEREGHLALLFYVTGERPVDAQIVLPGLLLPAPAPYGGRIKIDIPLVEMFPGGPDVAVIQIQVTLGPPHLTYYEPVGDKIIAYQPRDIPLPERCPHGGFPFSTTLTFLGGSHAQAHTTVPCPSARRSPRS